MKPTDIKSNTYINSIKEINDKDPNSKIDDIATMSKYKNIFPKWYVRNWSEEVFVVTKVKKTVPWTAVITDLQGEKKIWMFYKKRIAKKQIRKSLQLKTLLTEKAINKVCWMEGYNIFFDSWIDKKDIV